MSLFQRRMHSGLISSLLYRFVIVCFSLQGIQKCLRLRNTLRAHMLCDLGDEPRRDIVQELVQLLDGRFEAWRLGAGK
jgi:hypothetical protein